MKWIFLEPADVWLFRDGKPFDAGSDHRARSLFPPNPTTVQGAIRSRILAASGAPLDDFGRGPSGAKDQRSHEVSQVIGWPGEPPKFRLSGLCVARSTDSEKPSVTRFFPVPAHLAKEEQEDGRLRLHARMPLRQAPFDADWPKTGLLRPLWCKSYAKLAEVSGWLAFESLKNCLDNTPPDAGEISDDADLFARESRFGIEIADSSKTAEEGQLYLTEWIRPRPGIGILTGVDDAGLERPFRWEDGWLLALGGESRAARARLLDNFEPSPNLTPDPDPDGKTRLLVYLATPAWLDGGWKARDWGRWFEGSPVRLVSAALGGALRVGGIRVDAAKAGQKSIRRLAPAGSVFFLEGDGPLTYSGDPLTDDPDDAIIGFGSVLTGRWAYV